MGRADIAEKLLSRWTLAQKTARKGLPRGMRRDFERAHENLQHFNQGVWSAQVFATSNR